MKTKSTLVIAVIALLGMTSITSCKKKKTTEEDETLVPASGYVLGLKTTSAGADAEYLVTSTDLMSGTISATGNGIEQMGWMYYHQIGNKYLAMDYTNNICTGYEIANSTLSSAGSFVFDRLDVLTNDPGGNVFAVSAPWGGGSYDCKFQTVNPNSMSITSTQNVLLNVMYNDTMAQLNMWPTGTYINNGKLYVSYYPLHGASWDTPKTDTAYVNVYTYPGLNYVTTFKDARTGPIGYYGGSPAIIEDENGNHYTISTCSLAAGYTQATKPSGILRINSGQQQFDNSYFFNIEALGYKILTGAYIGNGKMIARVVPNSVDAQSGGSWAAFGIDVPIHRIAILDLNSQTLQIVNDVPAHGGQYYTPFYMENGKVFISVNTGSNAYIYRVDPSSGTAQQGATIDGKSIQCFFKY